MSKIFFSREHLNNEKVYSTTACGLSLVREAFDSESYDSNRIKLDRIMKSLFKLSEKYWEYSIEKLYHHQLYALLPLQVFKHRKPIQSIHISKKSNADKSRLITEQFVQLKLTVRALIDAMRKGYEAQHISPEELKKLLAAIQHLNDYLYTKYGEYETIEKEAYLMIKVLDDQRVMQQGIEKGIEQGEQRKAIDIAKNLLSQGVDLNLIVEATGLTHADVEQLRRE